MAQVIVVLAVILLGAAAQKYQVNVKSFYSTPVLSYAQRTSEYGATFNPTYVEPSKTQPKKGILARLQACNLTLGHCGGNCAGSDTPSVLGFAEEISPRNFTPITGRSIVFSPNGSTVEAWGTEDPRLALDLSTGIYYLFYTAYGYTEPGKQASIKLSLATTMDPTKPNGWTRHGEVFPTVGGSKSAALLIRAKAPHYLIWGEHQIHLAVTYDLIHYNTTIQDFINTRSGFFDDALVEAGPPPLPLSDGNLIFFYNSNNRSGSYQPGWVILDGSDPTKILQRSATPLLTPTLAPWLSGQAPWFCNVKNVVFLEAAHQSGPDQFDVYFGGADTVIGTATIVVAV